MSPHIVPAPEGSATRTSAPQRVAPTFERRTAMAPRRVAHDAQTRPASSAASQTSSAPRPDPSELRAPVSASATSTKPRVSSHRAGLVRSGRAGQPWRRAGRGPIPSPTRAASECRAARRCPGRRPGRRCRARLAGSRWRATPPRSGRRRSPPGCRSRRNRASWNGGMVVLSAGATRPRWTCTEPNTLKTVPVGSTMAAVGPSLPRTAPPATSAGESDHVAPPSAETAVESAWFAVLLGGVPACPPTSTRSPTAGSTTTAARPMMLQFATTGCDPISAPPGRTALCTRSSRPGSTASALPHDVQDPVGRARQRRPVDVGARGRIGEARPDAGTAGVRGGRSGGDGNGRGERNGEATRHGAPSHGRRARRRTRPQYALRAAWCPVAPPQRR